MSPATDRPMFLTVPQAAEQLQVSRSGLYRLMSDGVIPFRMIGGLRRIPREAIEAMVKETMSAAK